MYFSGISPFLLLDIFKGLLSQLLDVPLHLLSHESVTEGLCTLHLSDRHAKSSTGSWRRDILLLKDNFNLLLVTNKDLHALEHILYKSTKQRISLGMSEFFLTATRGINLSENNLQMGFYQSRINEST